MLSCVEYPSRKPAWYLVAKSVSSEKLFNLEFSIDVNNLPMQATNEIAR
jgi:hypothetical protein